MKKCKHCGKKLDKSEDYFIHTADCPPAKPEDYKRLLDIIDEVNKDG